MWTPTKDDSPLIQKIFRLKVEAGMVEPMEIARALDISHQTVYEVLNSQLFKNMEKEYCDEAEKYMEEARRRARLKARRLILDAAPDSVDALIKAMKDESPGVRASAVKASEAILNRAGLGVSQDTDNSSKATMLLVMSSEVAQRAKSLDIDLPEVVEVETKSLAARKGREAGEEMADGDSVQPDG